MREDDIGVRVGKISPELAVSTTDRADDEIQLRTLLIGLWRRKWLIVAMTLAGSMLAFALVSQVPPVYSARASVMYDPRSVQVLGRDDIVSDLTLNNPLMESEALVLRSNLLLEQVIAGIDPARLDAFDPANADPGLRARISDLLGNGIATLRAHVAQVAPVAAEEPAASPLLTEEERRMRRLVAALSRSLTVRREGQSYVINLSVETGEPELSAFFANTIVETYIANHAAQRSQAILGVTTFLRERVDAMQIAVQEAESRVEDFRFAQLAELGISGEAIEQQMMDLSTQLALARADVAGAEARHQKTQAVLDADGFAAAAELLSSPFALAMREELSALELRDAELATELGPDHPDRQRLRSSIDVVVADLSAEVSRIISGLRNDVDVAEIRATSIQGSLSELEARASRLSRASVELRQLEREANAVRDSYETALARLNETRSFDSLQRPEARIVERAVIPGAPTGPRVMLFSALGGAVGFPLGLAVALLLANNGMGFTRASEVERALELPLLASLPRGSWRSLPGLQKSLRTAPYQGFAERVRQLRNTLTLRSLETKAQTVLVTSAVAGEGKTTLAVALAMAETRANKSCVVLDFDLRGSTLARSLGYAPAGGDLADLLARSCTLDEAVWRVPHDGFDLITMKERAPQLLETARRDQIQRLLTDLKKRYDLVIIDTAPLLLVADTLPLARAADAALLLIKQGSTHRHAAREAARQLRAVTSATPGLVMTNVDPRDERETYGVRSDYVYES